MIGVSINVLKKTAGFGEIIVVVIDFEKTTANDCRECAKYSSLCGVEY